MKSTDFKILRVCSLMVSNLHLETKGSWFESSCYLCVEVSQGFPKWGGGGAWEGTPPSTIIFDAPHGVSLHLKMKPPTPHPPSEKQKTPFIEKWSPLPGNDSRVRISDPWIVICGLNLPFHRLLEAFSLNMRISTFLLLEFLLWGKARSFSLHFKLATFLGI